MSTIDFTFVYDNLHISDCGGVYRFNFLKKHAKYLACFFLELEFDI